MKMTRKGKTYVAISAATLIGITAAAGIVLHIMGRDAAATPAIVLGVFFCMANICSIALRDFFSQSSPCSITTFYLADKTARLLMSILLIGVLIYTNKANALIVGVMSFVYYIIAMALELSYFFETERKNKIQHA